ncbi:MAG: metallophosphoesterase family protein [Bacteroidia bacterium]|nr:metallophosphoesterase family protein [Bacteroidia bacterium]
MRKVLLGCLFLLIFTSVEAQKLNFNKNGLFKIAQFTDVHYVHGNPKSDTALMVIQRVLDAEKPDMVIFTGDIVTGKPVKKGWDAITKLVIDREIPFAVTLGNHDDENGTTRFELEKIITNYPYNCNYTTSGQLSGVMNNVIPVYGSDKDMQVKSLIYCFDSGAYSTINDVPGYGWITTDIIDWYKKQSFHFTKQNNFQPLPALAYFHIPLPEYRLAFNDESNKRVGVRKEDECPSDLNSGMFIAMKEMRDVMGTFVGHDHVNDYMVNYYDIALTYGRFSGWRTTYVPEINGSRIVVLKEGKREFDTWIRLLDGSIENKVTFPTGLINEKKKK